MTLENLNVDQVHLVARLAQAARAARDAMLGHGPDRDLSRTTAVRGERNPTAALGFDPLPAQNCQLTAQRDALDALPPRPHDQSSLC